MRSTPIHKRSWHTSYIKRLRPGDLKEKTCLLSPFLCSLAALEELSPGSLFLLVSWSDFKEVPPMACLKDHLSTLNTNKPASFKMLGHGLFVALVCILVNMVAQTF